MPQSTGKGDNDNNVGAWQINEKIDVYQCENYEVSLLTEKS